jgi:hypothetical protein
MSLLLRSLLWCLPCFFFLHPVLRAQPPRENAATMLPDPAPLPPSPPSDVLTPNTRRNTPALKIGGRAGFNRSSYTNDRYLDNVALDVGKTSGERDIYESAAGFGLQGGVDVEYPLNTVLSLLATGEYDYVRFAGSGTVQEETRNAAGDTVVGSSVHDFTATINYIKVAGAVKLNFPTFYLVFGLAAAHPMSTSLVRTRTLGDPSSSFPGTSSSRLTEEGPIPDPFPVHYSLRTGIGLVYQIGSHLQFSPELTLDFGFNAINKSRESDLGVYGVNAVLRYDL